MNILETTIVKPPYHYLSLAHSTAKARAIDSRNRSYSNRRGLDPARAEQYEILGALGEAAFYYYLGKEYRGTVNECRKQDYITCGIHFDIKTTRNADFLTIPEAHVKRKHNFIYVCALDDGTFEIIGYIFNKDILRYPLENPGNRIDKVTGKPAMAYVVPREAFKAINPHGRN